ncbi:MAG TPA: SDR family oxidoreductase, partial [Acidimicrobiales bacterium]|nr:SDR family oxidoreductase [Acidimicrobiales bacterium]
MIGPEDALLTDRVAVVTGAAVGIGAATAIALARFGADVAICDRDADGMAVTAAQIEQTGRKALTDELDVRDADEVEAFLASVAATFGHVDVLVNNAGGGFYAAFADVTPKGQDALIRENFVSVSDFIRGALPLMGPGSSIINITSIEAHRGAPGYAVYSAMKAAVANLTKTLALELGPRMIRINCVAPDVIPTPGIGPVSDPPNTPLPRNGQVDDVAGAVVWLAGSLSSFVTGSTVHVDGGNLAAAGWKRQPDGRYTT